MRSTLDQGRKRVSAEIKDRICPTIYTLIEYENS